MRVWIGCLAASVSLIAAGCSGEEKDGDDGLRANAGSILLEELDPVAVDGTAKVIAFQLGSAPNAFYQSYLPMFTADLNLQFGGTCPTKTEDGDTVTYTGGCTDDDGQAWSGTAVQEMSGTSSVVSYEGFGFLSTTSCGGVGYQTGGTWEGAIALSGMPAPGAAIDFQTDLVAELQTLDEESCETATQAWAIVYEGEMSEGSEDGDGDGEPDTQIFSGSGEIGVDVILGDVSIEGKVETSTIDEKVTTTFTSDSSFTLCTTEALSGETTHESDGHVTVVTYDGATDCDDESTVTWSYDGVDQGEVAGVGCTVSGVGHRGSGLIAMSIAAALALLVRRRR